MKCNHSTRFVKLLACLLSIVLICAFMFAIPSKKVMADTYGDYEYVVMDDNTVKITGYSGSASSLEIPAEINGMPVISIGYRAFSFCESITSITIPDSVTSIGISAFAYCPLLVSVLIPDSVTSIGNLAFSRCESLDNITIPDSITSIKSGTFATCVSLTSITIPNSVTSIESYAFSNCLGLKNITIPDSVTSIGDYAFEHCKSLISITIPDSVTSIGNLAFSRCESLDSITIPDSVTSIGENLFNACSEDLIINCSEGSAAHQYAVDAGIDCQLVVLPSSTPSQGNSTIPPATGNTVNRIAAETFVARCYGLVLNRTPDSIGLNNWANSLVNNQNTGAHMAYGFFFSQEYINSNTSNEEFVTTLYNVFLDRAPDQGGLNDWVGQLEAGATREQIFAGVANSREFFALCNLYGITAGHYIQGIDNTRQQNVNAFVARLYSMCLGRNGDYDGQASWVRQLINHENSGAGVGYGFFFSPEFINRNLTNEEYVATLYRVFLGREPDQAGFNSWVSQLNNGADRLSIFRGFAHSQEYTNICNSYGIDRGSI